MNLLLFGQVETHELVRVNIFIAQIRDIVCMVLSNFKINKLSATYIFFYLEIEIQEFTTPRNCLLPGNHENLCPRIKMISQYYMYKLK
jgi:hypothetical protein